MRNINVDTNKKVTVTRSQARKSPILANEIEETSQGPLKPKRKTLENTAKNSQSELLYNSIIPCESKIKHLSCC